MRNLFSTKVKIILVVAALLTAALAIYSGISNQSLPSVIVQGVLAPFRAAGTTLTNTAEKYYSYMFRYEALDAANKVLEERIAQMEDVARQADSVARENERLRKLLDLKATNEDYKLVDAYIIGWSSSDWESTFTINRGTNAGIRENLCAITANGEVVGLVTEVGVNYAVVKTVLDSTLEISGTISTSGYNGMVKGGYTSGNLGYSRVLSSKLAHVTGYDVLSFEYRLAPEFPYPAAAEDALRAWDYLMLQGYGARDIVLAGDSAGGNLALVLCNRLKAAGRKLPGALILMSPWTDMTMSGQSYTERAEIDPMLTPEYIEAVRLAYAAGRDYRSSDLSPLFADFTGFPPTLIQAGDHEILYSDSEQLYQAMKRANVPCRLQVSEGMWHVFQMFPIRKASVAIENIARFLLEQ